MGIVMLAAFVALLASCKKQPPADGQLAAALAKNGITVPAATAGTMAIPELSMMVLVMHDAVAADSPPSFAATAAPMPLFPIDPARAATAGADAKYRKAAGDPLIVPVVNVSSTYVERGTHTVTIAASEPVPAVLYDQLRASLYAAGLGEQYGSSAAPTASSSRSDSPLDSHEPGDVVGEAGLDGASYCMRRFTHEP